MFLVLPSNTTSGISFTYYLLAGEYKTDDVPEQVRPTFPSHTWSLCTQFSAVLCLVSHGCWLRFAKCYLTVTEHCHLAVCHEACIRNLAPATGRKLA